MAQRVHRFARPVRGTLARTSGWEVILTEEFPEGAYGASLNPGDKPGKVTPWEANQQVVSRYQDENPAFNEGTMPPPGTNPRD